MMRSTPMTTGLATLALAAALVVGQVARQIAVPERLPQRMAQPEATAGGVAGSFVTDEGVRLAWLLLPPARRDLLLKVARDDDGLRFTFNFNAPRQGLPARGSVVYLHGWSNHREALLPWALALSEQGWQGLLVDLRGHGQSGDAPAGYGPREAADVAQLVRDLVDAGTLSRPVHLFGVSYGAATALFAEPALRDVLGGIVALEPYASAPEAIRGTIAALQQADASGVRGRIERAALRRMDAGDIDRAIDEAGKQLGLDLRSVNVRVPVAATRTCLLLLHGEQDLSFPVTGSRDMAASTPYGRFAAIPAHNHVSLPVRADWLTAPIHAWLTVADARGDGTCPQFALPPEPPSARFD